MASSDVDCTDSGEALESDPLTDCDDGEAAVYPGATEVAYDGVDQDCDGADLCERARGSELFILMRLTRMRVDHHHPFRPLLSL